MQCNGFVSIGTSTQKDDPPGRCGPAGVPESGRVRLGNARREVVVHAQLFDDVRPGAGEGACCRFQPGLLR